MPSWPIMDEIYFRISLFALLVGSAWLLKASVDIHARVEVEVRLVLDRFGQSYSDDMQRTGHLLPTFRHGGVHWDR